MIIVSVRALRLDEATTSSRFTPEMERCPHTGDVSRLWLFAFPATVILTLAMGLHGLLGRKHRPVITRLRADWTLTRYQ